MTNKANPSKLICNSCGHCTPCRCASAPVAHVLRVEFWQGSQREERHYVGDTIAETLGDACEMFARYYAMPPAAMLADMLTTLERGDTHRAWSWFTVELV